MEIKILLTVELDAYAYANEAGILPSEASTNLAQSLLNLGDALGRLIKSAYVLPYEYGHYHDTVQSILRRPPTGIGGGIPLTRGEVAMLFLDGHAGDAPHLFDIRSLGYGDDTDWHGLTAEDVLPDDDTAFVWSKWKPLEVW